MTDLDVALAEEVDERDTDAEEARRFRNRLFAIMAVGLLVRLAYVVFVKRDDKLWGDAYAYYWSGRLLAEGHGFIQPLPWNVYHRVIHSPDRPPGYFLVLAGLNVIGISSVFQQKLFSVLIGTATIFVAAHLGKELAGRRVGLVTAVIVALYPNFWLHDGMLMSETLTIFTVTASLYLGYRYWKDPTWRWALALGVLGGYAALVHPDSVLILALIGAPLTLWATRNRWKTRLTHLAIIGVAGAAVISPWTIRNFVQFEEPVYLSTGLDVTMAVTNCDQAYHGQFRAFWYMPCVQFDNPPSGDLSQQAVVYRHRALDYMGDHKGELPALFAARVGRMWGFYRPLQQNHLDVIEGHEIWVSRLALGWFYLLLPAAGVGIVLLRKRRIPIAPMLAPVIVVTISAVITFGNTRYRAAAEITLAVAAAVAFVALGEWWVRRRDGGAPPEPVPPADDEPVLASIG